MPVTMPLPPGSPEEAEIDLLDYWDIIVDDRWLVAIVASIALAIGLAYAVLAHPIYEANLLIQVEDSQGSTKSFLGDATSLFDVKTPAAAEMELLRSRMVIGQAVDATLFYVDAAPRYVPVIGNWLARHAHGLSDPGFFGLPGYVSGTERIEVGNFAVPDGLAGSMFRVTAGTDGRYTLSNPQLHQEFVGTVGVPLRATTSAGAITLLVTQLAGKPGAEFNLASRSRATTIRGLQGGLKLAERGRQSGIIDARLQSEDPRRLTTILNEIGRQYVRQNVERKAAEAQKMLAFLDAQLPQFKKQLDQSEEAYNKYRNKEGTVALEEEAKLLLNSSVDLHSKVLEAQQKRRELVARFTPEHPAVKTLDSQIGALNQQIAQVEMRIRGLPTIQQDALRLERDAKVNNEAYQSLRNNALQLQLIREGKVGNVRLIDEAALPESPVKPDRLFAVEVALAAGLIAGVALALARAAFFRGLRNPQEVEARTGLSVYSTIPLSEPQDVLARRIRGRESGAHVLAVQVPHDPAVESLRSLRTALQFAMLESDNNRVLITGPTPGVGKSFVSANFAAVLATGGKRVLLIDADMRKGHLNTYFGVKREQGLSEVIAGTLSASEAVRRNVVPNLDLLTTGVMPPNPAELLMSNAFGQLLNDLSSTYDLVIIDTPPVLAAADTVGISMHSETVLLVARAAQTQAGELEECSKRLAQAGKAVTGVLFNAIDVTRRHYGTYGYRYGRYKYRYYHYEPSQAARP
jgi:tyrosine-protein kinase Etk/Wzc